MTEAIKMAATKSWQTTLAGVLTFVGALIEFGAVPLLDGVAATEPDWRAVAGAALICYGLMSSRDHGVSSEQAGVAR